MNRNAGTVFAAWSLCIASLCGPALAQETAVDRKLPHPFVYGGIQLNSGGYTTLSGVIGAGVETEAKRIISISEFSYDNGRKDNDGTVNNHSGHGRHASGRVFYRLPRRYFVGGGYQWNKLNTTNYAKEGRRLAFGGGKDWIGTDFSARLQALYIFPGTDWRNGVQGPEFQFWLPSPATKHHFFFRIKLGVYEYHQTITDPTNKWLTAQQTGKRSVDSWAEYTLAYRF